MTIIFPQDTQEISDKIKTDVQNQLPESNPFLKNSYLAALIYGYAGRIDDFYIQLQMSLLERFPDTATGIYLEMWGTLVGVSRNSATQSQGDITITGVVGSLIPVGTFLQSSDEKQYETLTAVGISNTAVSVLQLQRSGSTVTATTTNDHDFATGVSVTIAGAVETEYNGTFTVIVTDSDEFTYTITGTPSTPATGTITADADIAFVEVKSVDFGIGTAVAAGATLTFTSPIVGVDSDATVQFGTISGGTDLESDTDYRSRILFRWQNPVANFNDATVVLKAREVPGVTRVWVEDITPDLGQVTIYFVRDNDADIIPTPTEVSEVKKSILEIKPVNTSDSDVIVSAPTPISVDFTIGSLVPDSSTMRTSIISNLEQGFLENTVVGEDLSQYIYITAIAQTIDNETGDKLRSFNIVSPTGDITISDGELAILGNVVFT